MAYWRSDINDDYIHFYTSCQEIEKAKKISIGTIEEAQLSGHVRACPYCASIRKQNEAIAIHEAEKERLKKQGEEYIKKKNEEDARMEKAILCFMTVVFTFMACFFLFYFNFSKKADEAYNEGYQIGLEDGKEIGFDLGYEGGYSEGKSNGHNEGYFSGYNDATENLYADEYRNQTGDVVVYVTKTGNKYHRLDCSYLNDPVYYITLSQAQKDGYTACSRCDPPQ